MNGGRDQGPPSRHTRSWLVAAAFLGGAALWLLLDTATRAPPPVTAVASEVPGRSPLPFGDGPAVLGPDAAPLEQAPMSEASSAAQPPAPAVDSNAMALDRERFDALRWFGGDRSELVALAQRIDGALPAQLEHGGIAPDAALELKADLLDVLELDPTRRRAQLAAWWMAHPLASRAAESNTAARAEYERRELAALADWQAQRSEDRDAGELEETLETLQPGQPGP